MIALRIVLRISGLLCLISTALWAQSFPEIRLKDGRTLKGVEVLGYSASAFMARWEGGRGTVAYSNLPDDMRAEFEARRPKAKQAPAASEEKAPPAAKPPPRPMTEGRVILGEINAKPIERGAGYVTYAWTAEVINGTDRPQEVQATIKLIDKDGFELTQDYGDAIYVRAKQRGTITGRGLVKEALWDATDRFRVAVE